MTKKREEIRDDFICFGHLYDSLFLGFDADLHEY